MVKGNCCSFIIDDDNSVNVASLRLVEKLCLPTIPHPKSYRLQCLNEKGKMIINKQVLIKLTLYKYKDGILCNVVPTEVTYILLGRSWKFDRQVTHNGVTNKFSFVTLKPFSPNDVLEDQIKMKKNEMKKIEKLERIEKEKKKIKPVYLQLLKECLTSLKISFKRCLKDCHLFKESTIKLILCQVLLCLTIRHTGKIWRSLRRFKNK
ncbi:hypothetical protein CR513_32325, partial [Mucuna pruriens]